MARQIADLVIIDGQNGFCAKNGHLVVPGAWDAMVRVAQLIKSPFSTTLNDIHASLDSHPHLHISFNIFWQNSQGQNPPPFTEITVEDVENRRWFPVIQNQYQWALHYVRELRKSNRYVLRVWPPHCEIADPDSNLIDPLRESLNGWCEKAQATVDFVAKGSNWSTEHYSALRAEVIDPADASTALNKRLVETLERCDRVFWTGIAGDFCLKNTMVDAFANFGPDGIKKSVLLLDGQSSISPDAFNDFVKEMKSKGMQTALTTDLI
jgi:nicotinamidase/pyrazinamidase